MNPCRYSACLLPSESAWSDTVDGGQPGVHQHQYHYSQSYDHDTLDYTVSLNLLSSDPSFKIILLVFDVFRLKSKLSHQSTKSFRTGACYVVFRVSDLLLWLSQSLNQRQRQDLRSQVPQTQPHRGNKKLLLVLVNNIN